MKRFFLKLAVFLVIPAILCVTVILVSPTSDTANNVISYVTESDAYVRYEDKTKQDCINFILDDENDCENLVVGDSVSAGLFEGLRDCNDNYLFCSTNRSFTIAGEYVMIAAYLDTHANAKNVYMFNCFDTMHSTIDIHYGYQSLAVPLKLTGTYGYLEQETRDEIEDLFGGFLLNDAVIRTFAYSNLNHKLVLNGIVGYHKMILGEDTSESYVTTGDDLSPLTIRYLIKIEDLCRERGVSLYMLHDPLMASEESYELVETEREAFARADCMSREYTDMYFDSILYYDGQYFADNVHFITDDEIIDMVIGQMQEELGILRDLNRE